MRSSSSTQACARLTSSVSVESRTGLWGDLMICINSGDGKEKICEADSPNSFEGFGVCVLFLNYIMLLLCVSRALEKDKSTSGYWEERSEDDYEQIGVRWWADEEGIMSEWGGGGLDTDLMALELKIWMEWDEQCLLVCKRYLLKEVVIINQFSFYFMSKALFPWCFL